MFSKINFQLYKIFTIFVSNQSQNKMSADRNTHFVKEWLDVLDGHSSDFIRIASIATGRVYGREDIVCEHVVTHVGESTPTYSIAFAINDAKGGTRHTYAASSGKEGTTVRYSMEPTASQDAPHTPDKTDAQDYYDK